MTDGGPSTGTLATASLAGIIFGIILWVVLFFVVGLTNGGHAALLPAVMAAWVLLPVSVGVNATLQPRCPKRYAVIYTLACTVPLFGIVPAATYLGYAHHP
jgi:hypothetical protein